jgi:hypothetical protein
MAIFDQVRVPYARVDHMGGPSKRHSLASVSTKTSTQNIRQPLLATSAKVSSTPVTRGTMSRGPTMTTSKSVQIDQLQWLKSIKRDQKKDGSRSGTESGPSSRMGSRSRNPSRDHHNRQRTREESGSGSRDHREEEGSQTLQDE